MATMSPRHSRSVLQPHEECLGDIVAMVSDSQMTDAFLAAGVDQQAIPRGARRRLDTRYWLRTVAHEDAGGNSARFGDRLDRRGRAAGIRPKPMIDRQDDDIRPAGRLPPAVDAIEKGERIGAAGDGDRHARGFGERLEKRGEFAIGERIAAGQLG
jgi:hypothetical protein